MHLIDPERCPHHKPEPGMLFRAVRSASSWEVLEVAQLIASFEDETHGSLYLVEAPAGSRWLVHHKDDSVDGVHFAGRAVPAGDEAR